MEYRKPKPAQERQEQHSEQMKVLIDIPKVVHRIEPHHLLDPLVKGVIPAETAPERTRQLGIFKNTVKEIYPVCMRMDFPIVRRVQHIVQIPVVVRQVLVRQFHHDTQSLALDRAATILVAKATDRKDAITIGEILLYR